MTVTRTPNRAKTWASSQPIGPPPSTTSEPGSSVTCTASRLVQYGVPASPSTGGPAGPGPGGPGAGVEHHAATGFVRHGLGAVGGRHGHPSRAVQPRDAVQDGRARL